MKWNWLWPSFHCIHTLKLNARKFIVFAVYIANYFNSNLKQTRILYTYISFSYCHFHSFLVSIQDLENMFSASSISIFHIYMPSHPFPGTLDDSEIKKGSNCFIDDYPNANDDNVLKLILLWFGTSSFPLMQSTQPSHTCQASIHFFSYGHLHSQTSRLKPNPR